MAHLHEIAKQTALGTAGVAVITCVCFALHVDFPIPGCLYLLLVVWQSASASFVSSAIVSIGAIACLDYFFVPPVLTLRISRPADELALLTFLVTALVITRLASRARDEAHNAETGRNDLARLYELGLRLVSVSSDDTVKASYLPIFRDVFALRAMCLFDGALVTLDCDGESRHRLAEFTKQAYVSGKDHEEKEARIAVRVLRVSGKTIGAVGFEDLRNAEATAGPLSALAAAMIQRARAFEAASEAAATAQGEVLRAAILDAFAHQFKTPLATILAAAGSLREIGPLLPGQQDMVDTIETQSAGLGQLTTRLLRMARLDREEIRPKMRITDLPSLVRQIGDQYRNYSDDHALAVQLDTKPVEVLSDPEMLGLAISQLVDNAYRYSLPASTITVAVISEGDLVTVRVTSHGSRIRPEEQNQIFERFYRGAAGQDAAGTGLGLYVARKIVAAHGGALELDKEHLYSQDTTFYFTLPVATKEAEHEYKAG
ncbi:MAG: DUF4118 domain-containing protein [Acidobacteriia bacterium]|nr:DUF4118 domain-containing protein [Terriglobia bacterium]